MGASFYEREGRPGYPLVGRALLTEGALSPFLTLELSDTWKRASASEREGSGSFADGGGAEPQ
jgi:hypothetical protein